jgi:hypothetical protein
LNELGIDRPSSSRSFTRDVMEDALRRCVPEPMPRASILRPLSSTGATSHLAVSSIPSRAATPGVDRQQRRHTTTGLFTNYPALMRPSSSHEPLATADGSHRTMTTQQQYRVGSRGGVSAYRTSGAPLLRLDVVELPPWLPK